MADLTSEFLGIKSPNPFWLASAPPTDKAYNVNRAFEAGWGGAVWKTLGEDPPIVNVSGPRYGALHSNERRVIGFNNIELITDRPLQTNLDEIRQIKKDWPDRAVVASVMLPMNEETWAKYVPMVEDTGADAFELNFGCPHGMSERGMGAAVGQVPEYIQMAAEWCKKFASIPVIVKLTPNVTNILLPAKAALDGGADGVSLINTVNSIIRVDYDTLTMYPATDGMGSHGGYCGSAVKPIALHMVAEIARNKGGRQAIQFETVMRRRASSNVSTRVPTAESTPSIWVRKKTSPPARIVAPAINTHRNDVKPSMGSSSIFHTKPCP